MSRQYIEEAWNLLKEEKEVLAESQIKALPDDLYYEYFGASIPIIRDKEGNLLQPDQIIELPADTYYINCFECPEINEEKDKYLGVKFENLKIEAAPVLTAPNETTYGEIQYQVVSGEGTSFVAIPENSIKSPEDLNSTVVMIDGDRYNLSLTKAAEYLIGGLNDALSKISVPFDVVLKTQEKASDAGLRPVTPEEIADFIADLKHRQS